MFSSWWCCTENLLPHTAYLLHQLKCLIFPEAEESDEKMRVCLWMPLPALKNHHSEMEDAQTQPMSVSSI